MLTIKEMCQNVSPSFLYYTFQTFTYFVLFHEQANCAAFDET